MTQATQTSDERLDALIAGSKALLLRALAELAAWRDTNGNGRALAGICVLYSGGNDSTVLAHMFRDVATHAVHANTGIGIEATRQFVRDTCAAWGLPLIEKHPPVSYRDLVLERGFPGPGQHFKMYQRLKERCLRDVRRDLISNSYRQRLVFLAGRRAEESDRRAMRASAGELVPIETIDSIVWVSPLHEWTKLDLNAYRRRFPDCPRNEVSDHLHMSGECLCGSFAKPDELDMIGFFYPEVREEIERLQREVTLAGNAPLERCRWGWGAHRDRAGARSGPMCSSCAVPTDEQVVIAS